MKRYIIERPNTRKSKQKWHEFMNWWILERQEFDPMPTKLRAFKKQYNARDLFSAKLLYKWKQAHNENPIMRKI